MNERNLKATAFAASALAFASFGDAFLYPFLPVNNHLVGVPAVWIGVLLSINRFVRIFSNSFMVHLFSKFGLRAVMLCAVVLAIVSTAGYAIATGAIIWLIFRIVWGLSFSAMRIGTLGYSLSHSRRGLALGISRSLQETGPMAALLLAPFLLTRFEVRDIFLLLAAFSLPALWFAWHLPKAEDKTPVTERDLYPGLPSTLDALTLLSAIVIDGIIVVVLGILFLQYQDDVSLTAATALAALYLGYRRVCLVVFSVAGGWVADRLGLHKVFNISLALVILGLIVLIAGYIAIGAVVVFTFYSINAAITPGAVLMQRENSLGRVAQNATWRDIGAAIGTLTGGLLIGSSHITMVLSSAVVGLFILLLAHLGVVQRTFRIFCYPK